MKLYEINEEIMRLSEMVAFDDETGEVLCDIDDVMTAIDRLQMEKRHVLEYLAKLVLNLRSEAAAVKTEEERLKARRKRITAKADKLMNVLDRECAGVKTDLGVATVSYRLSHPLDISDEVKAVSWLREHKYDRCFTVPQPKIMKDEVKKLVKSGIEVPGCRLVDNNTCSLR